MKKVQIEILSDGKILRNPKEIVSKYNNFCKKSTHGNFDISETDIMSLPNATSFLD